MTRHGTVSERSNLFTWEKWEETRGNGSVIEKSNPVSLHGFWSRCGENVRECPEMSGEIKKRRTSIPECLPTTTVDLYKHNEWTKGVSDAGTFPG
jgi:hypothetical protein